MGAVFYFHICYPKRSMMPTFPLLQQVYNQEIFQKQAEKAIVEIGKHLLNTTGGKSNKTINWNLPDDELRFWKKFDFNQDISILFKEIFAHTTHIHHPKYIGHQVACAAPLTSLTAMISALLNNGMAVYEMGMAPTAIERMVTDAICKKLGYDSKAGGFLTSGGTLANLTALLAARRTICKEDIWNEGYTRPLAVIVCEEAHYCVDRAVKIMGLGNQGIIKIPAKSDFSMDTQLLENEFQKAIEKGITIFAIVGSAPSTATGAYDDLQAIAHFAEQKGIWFHVDGAHGGAAIYSKKYKTLIKGIDKADSVVIDGHKMMMLPTITTALLFKDRKITLQNFSQQADYLLDNTLEDEWYQGGKMTFECTKTMMSLHWYLMMKIYGEQVWDEYVTRQYDLAREFANLINHSPNFELATEPQSNILCFRYYEENWSVQKANETNLKIRQQLLEDGEYYLVQTKIRGANYLRTTLMNPFTEMEHLALLLTVIKNYANTP